MSEPTPEQLTARERAEAWLAAGKRHGERGEDVDALGCIEASLRNMAVSDMSDDEYIAMMDMVDEIREQCLRRLAGTLPEEVDHA